MLFPCPLAPEYPVPLDPLFHFLGLGFQIQSLILAKQALYHLTSSPFCSGYFGDGVSRTISLG
jgi:hypothetical protein